jgi:hypothetical protein
MIGTEREKLRFAESGMGYHERNEDARDMIMKRKNDQKK